MEPAHAPVQTRIASLAALAGLALLGAAGGSVGLIQRSQLLYVSIFYKQFAQIEPANLALVALFSAGVLLAIGTRPQKDASHKRFQWPTPSVFQAIAVAGIALVLVALGIQFVFHHFLLADDEYSAWFQANIFAHGQTVAHVAPQWCNWIAPLTPTSVAVPAACTWKLSFLELHSLLRSAFILLHIDWLAGPLTAAASVLLVGAIAKKAWPDRPERTWIAMIALVTSTQMLFMSMTMFSMPTHLLFSLIWIWCYVDNRRWSITALPLVGFLALGIHSPTPHVLLIPAFLLRYARDRRWGVLAYVTAVYAVAILFWARQLGAPAAAATTAVSALATPSATAGMARGLVALPSALQRATTAMQLGLVLTWNTPLLGVCILAAMLAWKRLDAFARDLALSIIIVLAARAVNPGGAGSQGEGWGYRYSYNALGPMALLAPWGIDVLIEAVGKRRALALAASSVALTLFIQIPLRAVQVGDVIRPYREASDWLESQPEGIVAFPAEQLLWARQLIRNDPFLNKGPKLMDLSQLTPAQVDTLEQLYPGQVRIVQLKELTRFGIDPWPVRFGTITWVPK